MSDATAFIIAVPISFLVALLLVGIGLSVSRKQSPQLIRRHSGPDTYWQLRPEQLSHSEGVLTAEHRPKHRRTVDDEIFDTSEDDTIILDGTIETWESYGRRGLDSPVRHEPVPSHWVPPIGELRIAILETMTAEYLFVRQPKDQLQPRMVRPYMTANVVG